VPFLLGRVLADNQFIGWRNAKDKYSSAGQIPFVNNIDTVPFVDACSSCTVSA